jgi:SAM-dependent methyltransferase
VGSPPGFSVSVLPVRCATVAGAESSYDDDFYDEITQWSRPSAEVVVPMVVGWLDPSSVVDVGCGRGTWLAAFERAGVADVLGLDGDYVDRSALEIDSSRFDAVDLLEPTDLGRRFDLAVSVEVAEHLPEDHAKAFVSYLCGLAPAVVFSAAVPGQGGRGHVNEQWPAYWAERFRSVGFEPLDVIRPRVWDDPRVAFFFAQNLVLYVREDRAAELRRTIGELAGSIDPPALVHPRMVEALQASRRGRTTADPSLSSLLKALPRAARKAVRRRIPDRRA